MVPSRRVFLQSLAAGAAASGVGVHAFDSGQRNEQPLMKLSLAAYSFNRKFARRGSPEEIANAEMRLEDFIEYCAEQQLGATELTGYYFPKKITTEYLVGLKQRTHRLGLSISGTAIGNDFCLANGPARDAQLQECRNWIDYAATMGAPVIRIFAGKVPKGDSEDAAIARCVAGINESLKYAAKKGVILALENHGGITATPKQMMKIIEGVDDSPWFGVNFDSGNFRTDDPYRDLAVIAPYAVNAQIKVSLATAEGKKYPADLKRIIGILKSAGYRTGIVGKLHVDPEEKFQWDERARVNGRAVQERTLERMTGYIVLYITVVAAGGMLIELGDSAVTPSAAIALSVSALSTAGPQVIDPVDLGSVGTLTKLTLSALMLLGRLSIYAVVLAVINFAVRASERIEDATYKVRHS